jgi:hypothetical protein
MAATILSASAAWIDGSLRTIVAKPDKPAI